MNKKTRQITLSEDTDNYLNEYMEEHGIRFPGEAMARICKEHEQRENAQWSVQYIAEAVAKKFKEVFAQELNRIRVGTNSADKNSQIIIELLNGIYFFENYKDLITTSIQEMDGVKTAKQEVHERISNQRQKKLEWEATRGGK